MPGVGSAQQGDFFVERELGEERFDVSCHGGTGFRFWIVGSGVRMRMSGHGPVVA